MKTDELLKHLDEAIERAVGWPVTGWPMTFGGRGQSVDNLEAARNMPPTFHNRLEALAYWQDVAEVSRETVAQGTKARAALEKGGPGAAYNALYFARHLEKRLTATTPTWGPVTDLVATALAES